MCGILGGINTDFDAESLTLLRHRGPDQHSFVSEMIDEERRLTLGQTRLNIVDRHAIDLPVRSGDAVILFNGEIYNHPELREELEDHGWVFETKTDTEVVLLAYQQWGASCLSRFNGMFAFAIWDGRRFFCARDRMGKKPFFYRCRGQSFEFASEVKVFSDLEYVGNDLFDLFEFCFNEYTIYRDIVSLSPGTYLIYDPYRGTVVTHAYWDIHQLVDHRITDAAAALETFIELLSDSVRLRLRADVPVALFLSGGVDSSIIAKLAQVDEAFTCQFEELAGTINEERYAADLAKRLEIELTIIRPTRDEFVSDLPSMAYHLELPTGSFSVFPLYRLAKASHDAGYKVVLSGDGCDELFAGYARNEFLVGDARDFDDPKVHSYRSMLRRYDGSDIERFCRMASRSGLAGAAQMRTFVAQYWSDQKSLVQNMCYIESRLFLQPLLQMGDRMTMAHSVEARCPYLDHRIVEFAFSLDDSLRYRDGKGKWLIHAAAEKLLPKDSLVLTRTIKHGLPTPVNLWMLGQHSFDRKYWNSLMTAECIKCLHRTRT